MSAKKRGSGTITAPDRKAGDQMPKVSARSGGLTLTVVKGNALPLSSTQRELVTMFIEYLRSLPRARFDDDGNMKNWGSNEYIVLCQLLTGHFRNENPSWKSINGGHRTVDQLPDKGDRFKYFMYNAASSDPINERRRELLNLARDKKWIRESVDLYEADRKRLGLKPENLIAPRSTAPATPLEIAAAASYEENHSEA